MIVVDSKEASKNKDIVEALKKLGAEVSIKNLPAGDYHIGKYLVERKKSIDIAGSIRDRRIFNEMLKMSQLEEFEKWLMIEGSWR